MEDPNIPDNPVNTKSMGKENNTSITLAQAVSGMRKMKMQRMSYNMGGNPNPGDLYCFACHRWRKAGYPEKAKKGNGCIKVDSQCR